MAIKFILAGLLIQLLSLCLAQQWKAEITPSSPRLVKKMGDNLVLTCRPTKDGEKANVHSIKWIRPDNTEITEELERIRIMKMHNHGQLRRLTFSGVIAGDGGKYWCKIFDENDQLLDENHVELVVDGIDVDDEAKIHGKNSEFFPEPIVFSNLVPSKVTVIELEADLARSPEVKCRINAAPKPNVKIHTSLVLDGSKDLPAENFHKTDEGYKIFNMSRDSPYQKLQCRASRLDKLFNQFTVAEKDIVIDVQYPPEFQVKDEKIKAYGIAGRESRLECNISQSNPKVNTFEFFMDAGRLFESPKFVIDHAFEAQSGVLKILDTEESDFGDKFACQADNGVFTVRKDFEFIQIDPPAQPQVAFHGASDASISFHLIPPKETGSRTDEKVPITKFELRYWKKREDDDESDGEIPADAQTVEVFREGDSETVYRVERLLADTIYQVEARAANPGGYGEPSAVISAETLPFGTSGSSQHYHIPWHFALFIFLCLFLR